MSGDVRAGAIVAAAIAIQPFVPSANWSVVAVADHAAEAALDAALPVLLAPLRELAAEMESHALGLTREATEDNPLRPLALFSDLVSNYRNLQYLLDHIEGKS